MKRNTLDKCLNEFYDSESEERGISFDKKDIEIKRHYLDQKEIRTNIEGSTRTSVVEKKNNSLDLGSNQIKKLANDSAVQNIRSDSPSDDKDSSTLSHSRKKFQNDIDLEKNMDSLSNTTFLQITPSISVEYYEDFALIEVADNIYEKVSIS